MTFYYLTKTPSLVSFSFASIEYAKFSREKNLHRHLGVLTRRSILFAIKVGDG